jgi:hypothetical protein
MAPELFEAASEAWAERFPELPFARIGKLARETTDPIEKGWEHYREK